MKKMSLLLLLASISAQAAYIELDTGIDLWAVNGEKVGFKDQVDLVHGDNQLVVQMDRTLRSGGEKEKVTSPPYVVVIPASDNARNLTIDLRSTNLKQVNKWMKSGESLFDIRIDGIEVQHDFVVLPSDDSYMPYSDIVGLVNKYNHENGIVYDSGKIRNLKDELTKSLPEGQVQTTQENRIESETSLQLKIWFNRATEQEKIEHLQWAKSQLK